MTFTLTMSLTWANLALWVAAFLWGFWGLYVLVMGLYRAHLSGRLSKPAYGLGGPYLAIGYAVDVLANLTVAVVVFAELPREWLVTDRLQRHIAKPRPDWRTRLAAWVCDHLLDVFDPRGEHC